jgi:hypothetical protein
MYLLAAPPRPLFPELIHPRFHRRSGFSVELLQQLATRSFTLLDQVFRRLRDFVRGGLRRGLPFKQQGIGDTAERSSVGLSSRLYGLQFVFKFFLAQNFLTSLTSAPVLSSDRPRSAAAPSSAVRSGPHQRKGRRQRSERKVGTRFGPPAGPGPAHPHGTDSAGACQIVGFCYKNPSSLGEKSSW